MLRQYIKELEDCYQSNFKPKYKKEEIEKVLDTESDSDDLDILKIWYLRVFDDIDSSRLLDIYGKYSKPILENKHSSTIKSEARINILNKNDINNTDACLIYDDRIREGYVSNNELHQTTMFGLKNCYTYAITNEHTKKYLNDVKDKDPIVLIDIFKDINVWRNIRTFECEIGKEYVNSTLGHKHLLSAISMYLYQYIQLDTKSASEVIKFIPFLWDAELIKKEGLSDSAIEFSKLLLTKYTAREIIEAMNISGSAHDLIKASIRYIDIPIPDDGGFLEMFNGLMAFDTDNEYSILSKWIKNYVPFYGESALNLIFKLELDLGYETWFEIVDVLSPAQLDNLKNETKNELNRLMFKIDSYRLDEFGYKRLDKLMSNVSDAKLNVLEIDMNVIKTSQLLGNTIDDAIRLALCTKYDNTEKNDLDLIF